MDKFDLPGIWVNNGNQLCGIFTERDYLHRIFLQNRSSKTTKIKDVMTSNVIVVKPNTSIFQTLKLMVDNKIRTLPVISLLGNEINYIEKDILVGMITTMDVIRFIIRLEDEEDEEDDNNITTNKFN